MVDSIDTGVYLKFFKGREDYFAQQTEDGYSPVNKAFNEYYLEKHLMGNSTFGIYVLNRNSFCHFFCIDIDIPRELLNEVNYRDASVKYCFLKGKISIVVKTLLEKMGIPSESILLEDTGGRGYHIWVFFSEAIKGSIVFALGELLKKHLDFEIEFFPKQGVLTARRKLGNLIKLPLGIHKKYNLRSCFLRLVSLDKLLPIDNIFGNIEYLNSIQQITTDLIENLIGATMEPIYQPHADYSETIYRSGRTQFGGGPELFFASTFSRFMQTTFPAAHPGNFTYSFSLKNS